jgi:hypothetical protein
MTTHDSTKRLTGSTEYWERAIAAQLGWPLKQHPKRDPDALPSTDDVLLFGEPSLRETSGARAEPEFEPVYGWTRRQLNDFLTRNPAFVATYEAELGKRRLAGAARAKESPLTWFPLWGSNHDKATGIAGPNGAEDHDANNPAREASERRGAASA